MEHITHIGSSQGDGAVGFDDTLPVVGESARANVANAAQIIAALIAVLPHRGYSVGLDEDLTWLRSAATRITTALATIDAAETRVQRES